MTATNAATRIRAYLDALPNSLSLGAELAYGRQFRTDDWPHDSYPLTRDDLEDVLADAMAFRRQPALRHCLYPGCLSEFDAMARLAGQRPARPSWSGEGWLQMRPTILTGYICPDHAQLARDHRVTWQQGDGRVALDCACGWTSPTARWRRVPEAAWQEHLLNVHEPLTAGPAA